MSGVHLPDIGATDVTILSVKVAIIVVSPVVVGFQRIDGALGLKLMLFVDVFDVEPGNCNDVLG